ncbi:MAG: hypothetical protein R3C18_14460 [Planctomycetaceae bacterium]
MKINHSSHQLPQPKLASSRDNAPTGRSSGAGAAGRANESTSNVYADLLAGVREDQLVRPNRVAEAKDKLQSGALNTRAVAEETAAALLREFS